MIPNPYLARMYRALSLLLLLTLLLLSCGRIPKPRFSWYPESDLESGDSIWFFDESKRADALRWDFGDGNFSEEYNPIHVYDSAGIFEVYLHAENTHGENLLLENLVIHEPTVLGFWVMDSAGMQSLAGAEVSGYAHALDRDSLRNPLFLGITDDEGRIEFSNMDRRNYHVRVHLPLWEGSWKYTGQTGLPEKHRINYFTVLCAWEPGAPHQ